LLLAEFRAAIFGARPNIPGAPDQASGFDAVGPGWTGFDRELMRENLAWLPEWLLS
jgi:hypothetical protein